MNRKYQPKRSTQRWLKGAPDYILACYDNGGKTIDRYAILFGGKLWHPEMGRNVQILFLGDNIGPQGVSMWGEAPASYRTYGKKIRWADLPKKLKKHIQNRANDDF